MRAASTTDPPLMQMRLERVWPNNPKRHHDQPMNTVSQLQTKQAQSALPQYPAHTQEVGITLQRGGVCPTMEKGVTVERALELALHNPLSRQTETLLLEASRGRILGKQLS